MTSYKDTGEFFALKLPNLDREWVEEVNKEMGWMKGNGKIEALFSNFRFVSSDLTKRILKKKK